MRVTIGMQLVYRGAGPPDGLAGAIALGEERGFRSGRVRPTRSEGWWGLLP